MLVCDHTRGRRVALVLGKNPKEKRRRMGSNYESAQTINFKLYTLFGFWKINSENPRLRLFYSYYRTAVIFSTTLFTLLQITDLKDSFGDIELMSNNLSATSTSVMSISKVYILGFRMKRIESLRERFKQFLDFDDVGRSEEDKEIFENNGERYLKLTKTYYAVIWPTILVWGVLPMLTGSFPVRLWLPFDPRASSGVYVSAYVFECVLLCFFAATVLSMDLILTLFIYLTCGHFEVLKKNISNLKTGNKSQEETDREIVRCVKHHQEILRVVREVNEIFRTTNLIHFFSVAVLMTFTEYDALQKTSKMNLQFVRQLGNLASIFFDSFLYCYSGSLLEEKSLEISEVIYDTFWLNLSPKSRRNLLFVMARAQKKAAITAGKFFDMNRENYLAMLRNTYNLLAVLRQIN